MNHRAGGRWQPEHITGHTTEDGTIHSTLEVASPRTVADAGTSWFRTLNEVLAGHIKGFSMVQNADAAAYNLASIRMAVSVRFLNLS